MDGKYAKGRATRARIVEIATGLFAGAGYDATSIETVLAKSAISRGALYHHFADKAALFEAVLEAIEADIARTLRAASLGIGDPVAAMRAGGDAWLKLSRDPAVRQIVLIDAPSVLGWQKWREIDARFGFGLIKAGLKNLCKAGRLDAAMVEPLSHVLLASMMELALVVARADRPSTAAQSARLSLHRLIDRLLAEPATATTRPSSGAKGRSSRAG
ncbi:MAG: TetR/AcrR family transcriptional regulator [Alphaproteobacteria bacterium]|nr:TetR/AcrR family transcriptional regulator [Alphaproteobacteria bacterium]MCW5742481.1 TetR/AcrR family transcriptional regulator [Alphaproteobacteria bacterium]